MKANSRITVWKDMVILSGVKVKNMKVFGRRIR
jgi:hypothetical protein